MTAEIGNRCRHVGTMPNGQQACLLGEEAGRLVQFDGDAPSCGTPPADLAARGMVESRQPVERGVFRTATPDRLHQ